MTKIYFKTRGKLAVFEAEGILTHAQVLAMIKKTREKVDGAVMLVYG